MRALIVTPLQLEFLAMAEHLVGRQEVNHERSVYTHGTLRSRDDCEICLVEAGAGNANAGVAAANAINYFQPDVLLLVGIAACVKDVEFGDVVAADTVINYERGKALNRDILSRFDGRPCSFGLLVRARAVSRNAEWKQQLQTNPKSVVGTIVSGEKVVAGRQSPTFKLIQRNFSHALALETEGRGVLEAAYQAEVAAIDIRGISDFADEAKSIGDEPGQQQTAAQHAAAFAAELLRTHELPGRQAAALPPELPETPDFFPPAAAPILEDLRETNPEVYRRLLAACAGADVDLPAVVKNLITERPAWVADDVRVVVALAHLASGQNLDHEAMQAFEAAALAGHPIPSHWLAWAALHAMKAGEVERAEDLLSRARAVGPDDALVEIFARAIANDQQGILAVRDDESQLDDEERLLVTAMRANALILLERWDEAERLFRLLTREHPDRAMVKVQLASLINGRANRQQAGDRQGELAEARELGTSARNILRRRRMDSSAAVMVLCQTALLQGDARDALDLALAAPEGEATPAEAQSSAVAPVAVEAAITVGAGKLAERFLEYVQGPFEKPWLSARVLLHGGGDRDLVLARLSEALETAPDDARRGQVLMVMADIGLWPLPIDPEKLDIDAAQRQIILARSERSRGMVDAAMVRLRAHQTVSLAAAEELARVYLQNEDVASAIDTLATAAERFQAPELRLQALDVAREAGLWSEATRIGEDALGVIDPQTRAANYVRYRLVDIAARVADWQTVERYARVQLRDDTNNTPLRWAYVISLFNQARFPEAWAAFTAVEDLQPESEYTGRMMIELVGRFLEPVEAGPRILEVAETFADSEEVVGAALATVLRIRAPLSPELTQRLQTQMEGFLSRFPESTYFRRVAFETVEKLLEMTNQQLGEGAEELGRIQSQVSAARAPYGLLVTAAKGRPYLHSLIGAAGGALVGVSSDEKVRALEREAAGRSLAEAVVVEASAMVTWAALPNLWNTVVGAFRRVLVTDASVFDAVASRDEAGMRPAMVLAYNPDSERARPIEVPPEEAERIANHTRWVSETFLMLDLRPIRALTMFPGLEFDRYGAWLAAVELAVTHHLPLYSDDLALRLVARSHGVVSFGTHELVSALEAAGRISPEQRGAIHEAMMLQHVVDLPEAPELILRLGGAHQWESGPWLVAASRTALWTHPEVGIQLFGTLFVRVAAEAPDHLPEWTVAAMLGGGALPQVQADEFVAHLALSALFATDQPLARLTEFVGLARQAARRLKANDPLSVMARKVITLLEGSLSPEAAAQAAVGAFSGLEEPDRITVFRVIADPKNRGA
jgi:nucleoside phosphorylase